MRIVVALGGNAVVQRGERGTAGEQHAAIREACEGIAALGRSAQLIVTHGNGPQVGALLLQQHAAEAVVPSMPLDVLVAKTQGQLGYMLQQELRAALRRRQIERPVVTLVTQVVVDAADPAFVRPSKPIGPYIPADEAELLRKAGVPLAEMPGGAWRRVVPSPAPLAIVEVAELQALVEAGAVPIAGGGGGVPVVVEGNGYRGVEAVVDKDLTAALLAECVGADALVILTDTDHVLLDRGTRRQRAVQRLPISLATAALRDGQFPRGSMGPKIEAAISAVRAGRRAVIASLSSAAEALDGAGTEIVA